MHDDPVRLIARPLDLTEVHPGPDVQPEILDPASREERASHRVGRSLEDREEPVSVGVDLSAAARSQLFADDPPLRLQQTGPAFVSRLAREAARTDDLREPR